MSVGVLVLDCFADAVAWIPGVVVGPISSARRNSDERVSEHAESTVPATINAMMV